MVIVISFVDISPGFTLHIRLNCKLIDVIEKLNIKESHPRYPGSQYVQCL